MCIAIEHGTANDITDEDVREYHSARRKVLSSSQLGIEWSTSDAIEFNHQSMVLLSLTMSSCGSSS